MYPSTLLVFTPEHESFVRDLLKPLGGRIEISCVEIPRRDEKCVLQGWELTFKDPSARMTLAALMSRQDVQRFDHSCHVGPELGVCGDEALTAIEFQQALGFLGDGAGIPDILSEPDLQSLFGLWVLPDEALDEMMMHLERDYVVVVPASETENQVAPLVAGMAPALA